MAANAHPTVGIRAVRQGVCLSARVTTTMCFDGCVCAWKRPRLRRSRSGRRVTHSALTDGTRFGADHHHAAHGATSASALARSVSLALAATRAAVLFIDAAHAASNALNFSLVASTLRILSVRGSATGSIAAVIAMLAFDCGGVAPPLLVRIRAAFLETMPRVMRRSP